MDYNALIQKVILPYELQTESWILLLYDLKSLNTLIQNRDIKLKGFADRIDRFYNRIIINNYKTGSTAKIPSMKKISELDMKNPDRGTIKNAFSSIQLPMYVYLYNQMHPLYDFESIDAQLIMLREKDMKRKIVRLFNNQTVDRMKFMEERFIPVLHFLINEILNKDIDFVPDHSDSRYCDYCPYKGLCR